MFVLAFYATIGTKMTKEDFKNCVLKNVFRSTWTLIKLILVVFSEH